MKILIFGKNGQLGQELLAQAAALGIEAIGVGHAECDIAKVDQVAMTLDKYRPEAVVNATAYNLVKEAEINIEEAFAINAFAVFRLAKLCSERGIRFVTVSTDYVFDGAKGAPYTEEDAPNPLQSYGLSKLAGELAARNANSDALIVRTCGVYGGSTGSAAKKGNFILYILKEAEILKELEVGSAQRVNPTFARHLSVAILKLLLAKAEGGVYHLASIGDVSWAEFAEEIMKITRGRKMKIIPVPRRDFDLVKVPLFSALKNVKAKNLGIELPDWREGLAEYLKDLQS